MPEVPGPITQSLFEGPPRKAPKMSIGIEGGHVIDLYLHKALHQGGQDLEPGLYLFIWTEYTYSEELMQYISAALKSMIPQQGLAWVGNYQAGPCRFGTLVFGQIIERTQMVEIPAPQKVIVDGLVDRLDQLGDTTSGMTEGLQAALAATAAAFQSSHEDRVFLDQTSRRDREFWAQVIKDLLLEAKRDRQMFSKGLEELAQSQQINMGSLLISLNEAITTLTNALEKIGEDQPKEQNGSLISTKLVASAIALIAQEIDADSIQRALFSIQENSQVEEVITSLFEMVKGTSRQTLVKAYLQQLGEIYKESDTLNKGLIDIVARKLVEKFTSK